MALFENLSRLALDSTSNSVNLEEVLERLIQEMEQDVVQTKRAIASTNSFLAKSDRL